MPRKRPSGKVTDSGRRYAEERARRRMEEAAVTRGKR